MQQNLLAYSSQWCGTLIAASWLSLGITRLGALASGLAVGVLAIWWYSRRRQPRKEQALHSPQRLFQELCRAHRLSAAQELLLEWVVSDRQLAQPAMVFLDPLLLEQAMARSDAPGVRKRLADLRSRLFARLQATAGDLAG
jgi:hypothetical protein